MQFTINELSFISKQYDTLSDLSFFRNVKAELQGSEEKTLNEKGVIKNGKLTEPINTIFDVLAKADKSARFVMKMTNAIMEKGVYSKDDKRILVENMQGEIVLTMYDDKSESVRQEIAEQTGMSIQKNSVIDILVSIEDVLLITNLVDWLRKMTLLEYSSDIDIPVLSVDKFKDYLKKPMRNSLAKIIASLYELSPISSENIEDKLKKLEQNNFIEIKNNEISISQPLVDFGMSFLIPETQIVLETFDGSTSGPIITASSVIIGATPKDILSLTATDEGMEMSTMSSGELLRQIDAYLKCPNLE
ncbi:hypothetical protein [Helicovermis profundi]|uniref:Uncharacterized protein n=1 Tax=Helicovermis profundi TaxID=3065157 RepID=A0AAU9E5W7_9FIRM|nr:hypothetical protein HLPR_03430 [Clostridia bacterium S502]